MKKFFYVMIALAVCMMLYVSVSAETVTETFIAITEANTETAVETTVETTTETTVETVTETSARVETDEVEQSEETESERDYWAALWGQITDWISGHPEAMALLATAGSLVGAIITVCKKSKSLITMALALRREGDEKNTEARVAISENQKEMVAIAEENKEMQERILAAEEKNAKAMAGMAWCVERLIEESNLPTYKKDEIRATFNKTVGGDGNEGTNQA